MGIKLQRECGMKKSFFCGALCIGLLFPMFAYAHSALFDCFDNGDGTVLCQGGFSDGSSAQGVHIRIKDRDGNILQEARLDSNSEVVLEKPEQDFTILFDGGAGHSIEINGRAIQ